MFKYRAALTKGEELRYISHLDYASMLQRVICRAKLPAAYSEGFNPHLKISFATAIPVGIIADDEFMEFELTEELPLAEIKNRLNMQLPAGIKLLRLVACLSKLPKLMSVADEAVYEITFPDMQLDLATLQAVVAAFNAQKECVYHRVTPKKTREIEVKQYIKKCEAVAENNTVKLLLSIILTPTGSIKPGEVLQLLQHDFRLPVNYLGSLIRRTRLLTKGQPLV